MSDCWIEDLKKCFFSPRCKALDIDAAMELKKANTPSKLYKYRRVDAYSSGQRNSRLSNEVVAY